MRQAGDIAKMPELTAEGPRKNKGRNHKNKESTLGPCLGLYSKEESTACHQLHAGHVSQLLPALLEVQQHQGAHTSMAKGSTACLPQGESVRAEYFWGAASVQQLVTAQHVVGVRSTEHSSRL